MTSGEAISPGVQAADESDAPLDRAPSGDADDDDFYDDDESLDFAADDRRAVLEPPVPLIGRVGRLMPYAGLALSLHLAFFAALALFARTVEPIPAQSETTVEIVQEIPKAEAEKKPAAKSDFAKLDDVQIAKPEPLKPEPPQVEPPQVEAPKVEAPKVESSKPETSKPEAAKTEPPKADPSKPEPPQSPAPSATDPEAAKAIETMRTELAALQAQKETLQHEAAADEANAAQSKAARDQAAQAARAKAAADAKASVETKALGLELPDAFMAVAMPGQSVDGEVGASYQSLVFSLLAKARKTVKLVVRPGVAGVAFTIDDAGKLASVSLDHPSGDKGLDDEAIAIVRRAAPFPRPLPGGQRTFSAAMRFYIDD